MPPTETSAPRGAGGRGGGSAATRALILLTFLVRDGGAADAGLHWEPLGEPGSGGAITALAVSPHDSRRVLVGGDMLGVGLSVDRGAAWRATFDLPSYEIADFTFHPTEPLTVWVGTMSGPCVSHDGGRHWQNRRAGFPPFSWGSYSAPVQKILFDPQQPRRLVALGGSRRRWHEPDGKSTWAVWESRDDGEHWVEISRIDGAADVMAAIVVASPGPQSGRIFVALHDKGVWESADGGRTWQSCSSGLSDLAVCGLAADPSGHGRLWAAVGAPHGDYHGTGGLFSSTDGGAHWSRAELPGHDCAAVSVCASAPATVLASIQSWQGGTLFLSSDGGTTWKVTLHNPNFLRAYRAGAQMAVVEVDPRDPSTMFAGNTETISRSTDGGKRWEDASSVQADDGAWAGRGYSGLCCIRFRFDPQQPGHAALVAMDNGNLWQSRDGCAHWTWGGGEHFPGWGGVHDIAFAGDHGLRMFLALDPGDLGVIARTGDGGRHWEACPNRGLPGETMLTVCARPEMPQVVWAASRAGRVYRSRDGGAQWGMVLDAEVVALGLSPHGGQAIFAGGKRGLQMATDGEHFTPVPGGPTGITALAVADHEPLQVAVVAQGALWTCSAGQWRKVCERELIGEVVIDPADPRRIAFATSDDPYHDQTRATGVWTTSDAGATWSQRCDGLPMLRGGVLALDPHDVTRLVFGTNGRGYFVARWAR
ncbi:MAG: hypothetical protein H0X38_09555 [Planctomycetes bacterium]|nr:hypothetical protein [Planctomycetota bacterium]